MHKQIKRIDHDAVAMLRVVVDAGNIELGATRLGIPPANVHASIEALERGIGLLAPLRGNFSQATETRRVGAYLKW